MKNFNLATALAETQAIQRKLSALASSFRDSHTVNGWRISAPIQREYEKVALSATEAMVHVADLCASFEALREVAPSPKGERIRKNVRLFGRAKLHKELSFGRAAYQEDDILGLAWLTALENRRVELGLPESLEDGAWDVTIADPASRAGWPSDSNLATNSESSHLNR